MTFSIFIDESGHSGDAVNSGNAYDFLDQPYFVLAAVGIENEAALAHDIDRLKSVHSISPGELKSASLPSHSTFIADLIGLVCDRKLPFFIEVVDKKYFICIHLVNSQLLPAAIGLPEGREMNFIKNTLVDFLYDEVSDDVLNTFVAACISPSDKTLTDAFESQRQFAAKASTTATARDIRAGMQHMILEAISTYEKLRESTPDAYLNFLPVPDLGKRRKQVWMLPNMSSFTNIYARINLFRKGRLADVRLVHDQQLEVAHILRTAKEHAESIKETGFRPFTPQADYVFKEKASLEFAISNDSTGIQIADILAGTLMRFYRARLRKGSSHSAGLSPAISLLLRQSGAKTGVGINRVMPLRHCL